MGETAEPSGVTVHQNENVQWKPARNSPRFVQTRNTTNPRQRVLLTFLFSVRHWRIRPVFLENRGSHSVPARIFVAFGRNAPELKSTQIPGNRPVIK
jgi:hypothetical protein